ncbi:hypothetical protein GCM10010437_052870 [Actinoplanes palleronii]
MFTERYEVTAVCAVATLVLSLVCGTASTCISELIIEEVLRPLTRPSTELVTVPAFPEQSESGAKPKRGQPADLPGYPHLFGRSLIEFSRYR